MNNAKCGSSQLCYPQTSSLQSYSSSAVFIFRHPPFPPSLFLQTCLAIDPHLPLVLISGTSARTADDNGDDNSFLQQCYTLALRTIGFSNPKSGNRRGGVRCHRYAPLANVDVNSVLPDLRVVSPTAPVGLPRLVVDFLGTVTLQISRT